MLYRKGNALYDDNDNEVYSMADVRREEKEAENERLMAEALDELQERYENINLGYENKDGEMEDWGNDESLFYYSERKIELSNGETIDGFTSFNNQHENLSEENINQFIQTIRKDYPHFFQKEILEKIHQNGITYFEENKSEIFDKLIKTIFEKELLSSPSNQKHFERRMDDFLEFDRWNSQEEVIESFFKSIDFVIEKNEQYDKLLNRFVDAIKKQKVDYLFEWDWGEVDENGNEKVFYNRFPLKNVLVSEMEKCTFSKKIFYVEGDVIYKKEKNPLSNLGVLENAQISKVIDGKRVYVDNLGEPYIVTKEDMDDLKGFHVLKMSYGDKALDAFYKLDKKVNERPFFKPNPNDYSSKIKSKIEEEIDAKVKQIPVMNVNLIK